MTGQRSGKKLKESAESGKTRERVEQEESNQQRHMVQKDVRENCQISIWFRDMEVTVDLTSCFSKVLEVEARSKRG